MKCRRLKQKFL